MRKYLSQVWKKSSALLLACTLIFSTLPAVSAVGVFSIAFNASGASNFPVGTNITFNITGAANVPNQNNTYSDNLFPDGTSTITAQLPANVEFTAGAGYNVTGTNTATVNMTNGATLNVMIALTNSAAAPPAPSSTVNLSFDASGASNFPVGTNITFGITGATTVPNQNNTYSDNGFGVGTHTVTAQLPANTQLSAGAGYSVTGTNTLNFDTTNGGSHNLVFIVANTVGGGGGAGASTVNLSFDASGASNFPVGTNITFGITGATTVPNQNNTYSSNGFGVGTHTITAQLPANTQLGSGAGYSVTGTNTINFDTTNGGTHNLVFVVANTAAGGGVGTSTVNLSFDASGAGNFPVGTNITFGITGATTVPNQNNTYSSNGFGVGTHTITAQLPANTQLSAGAGYSVTGANTVNFDTTNGGTHNLVFVVANTAAGGGVGGGGGGRRRTGIPTITFVREGKTITTLDLPRGEDANVTVVTTDGRGGSINLTLSTDPTVTNTNTATFSVSDQNTAAPVGTLSWTPVDADQGQFDFIFTAQGNSTTTATIPITIAAAVNPGATGGGGGGGVTIEERIESCEYSDNKSESVIYLCLLGIIDAPNEKDTYDGKSKNKRYFGRDKITRAAFTKIMINITYEDATIDRVKELINKNAFYAFPDVEPVAWFSRFITVAKLDDHVHGYPDLGLFVPWNDIEISEAVKILFNTARHDNEKIQQDLSEAEADLGEDAAWYTKFAALAFKYGGYTPSMEGKNPGDIYSKKLTRQQASDIIYTTILNAGIEPKSHVSALKEELIEVQGEIEEAEIELELDPMTG